MHKVPGPGLALALATLAPIAAAAAPSDRLAGVRNVEDLAAIQGSDWVIGSSMAGGTAKSGRLVAINARSGETLSLHPSHANGTPPRTPDCPGEVAGDAFKPHGIALRPGDGDRPAQLYVVNHGGRESVEMFDLLPGETPRLRWTGCALLPQGTFGNGVAPAPGDGFFMTNMGKTMDGRDPVTPMGGDILAWAPSAGWRTVPESAIAAPNGIIATPDGRTLYVASWTGSALVELKLGEKTERRTLGLDFLPDNLRWSRSGTMLAAGQATSVQAVIVCYTSSRDACDIPSAVAEVDPSTLRVRCTLPVALDIATVAAEVGKEVWIGTTRGTAILRLPATALHDCAAPASP